MKLSTLLVNDNIYYFSTKALISLTVKTNFSLRNFFNVQWNLFMAYSLLYGYLPWNAKVLQRAGTSIIEMQAVLHIVYSACREVGFQICDVKNKTTGVNRCWNVAIKKSANFFFPLCRRSLHFMLDRYAPWIFLSGPDPEVIYNLCLDFKNVVIKTVV